MDMKTAIISKVLQLTLRNDRAVHRLSNKLCRQTRPCSAKRHGLLQRLQDKLRQQKVHAAEAAEKINKIAQMPLFDAACSSDTGV